MIKMAHTPWLIRKLMHPRLNWGVPVNQKKIFLTFDDGPVPNVTPEVLHILNHFNIKASFFCVGDNIRKHPSILQQVIDAGHTIGCHTFNHLKGWNTPTQDYINNVLKCQDYYDTPFFRPPYGKITRQQINHLPQQYIIILWTVLSYDWDQRVSPQECLDTVIQHTQPGAIIVFHDHAKAMKNLRFALPRYIQWAQKKGYSFETLQPQYFK